MQDKQIIELFFARSERAIDEMNTKYGGLCRKLAYSMLNNAQDAEECVNDAYLGVWNAVPPARPEPLSAYVCRVVRNVSLKLLSRRGAEKRGGGYEATLQELDGCLTDGSTAEDALEARELARLIEGFLDTLSRENRVIFMRRYWFADSYEEIAARVGVSVKNVSVRLTRLRARLREHLIKEGMLI